MTSNARTDAVIVAWLEAGPTGLTARERSAIADSAELLGQRHAFPDWLPRWRPLTRRVVVLAAATLALVVAGWALLSFGQPTPTPTPSVTPEPSSSSSRIADPNRSNEVDAFVLGSYERFFDLPAFRLRVRGGPDGIYDGEYFYDRSQGLLTHEPGGQTLHTAEFIAHRDRLDGREVWVVSEGFWGDPTSNLARIWGGPTNCASGWESVEATDLIGRPTRHVRCTTEDAQLRTIEQHLWIDFETGLPLRHGQSAFGQSGMPRDVHVDQYADVTELEIGPQPADLFVLNGETISSYDFACATDGQCPSPRPSVLEPVPMPIVSPPPAPISGDAPVDLAAYVARVRAGYDRGAPVDVLVDPGSRYAPGIEHWSRWRRDGVGNHRFEYDDDRLDSVPGVTWLSTGGRTYETDRGWRDWGPGGDLWARATLGLPTGCGFGWLYLGDDLVLNRAAAHVACGFQEFWIDREWLLVTRAHDHDPLLGDDPGAGLTQIISVTFGPQPSELFAEP